jgi:glutaminyl-tRNA synthetase
MEENLDLFERMRAGEFEDGARVLRAKIDMAHPNLIMRDPTLYRIRNTRHHRTGDAWCIYPMYDFTHCLSDSIEGITHSLCTLEFEQPRPVRLGPGSTWTPPCHPQQIEFARLNLSYTVLSKRKLIQLVEEGHVSGWDDPRMPTICRLCGAGAIPPGHPQFLRPHRPGQAGQRGGRGPAGAQRPEDLNRRAPRVMGVLNPLKVVIENYPEGQWKNWMPSTIPKTRLPGNARFPFSREIYIERDDFMENPPKKFFRLGPGREVRLRYAFFITCTGSDQG